MGSTYCQRKHLLMPAMRISADSGLNFVAPWGALVLFAHWWRVVPNASTNTAKLHFLSGDKWIYRYPKMSNVENESSALTPDYQPCCCDFVDVHAGSVELVSFNELRSGSVMRRKHLGPRTRYGQLKLANI